MALTSVSVNDNEYNVISEFPVLHQGWECDSIGYIVQDGKKQKIVLTSHGYGYFAKSKDLEELIRLYKEALRKTKMALLVRNGQLEVENEKD